MKIIRVSAGKNAEIIEIENNLENLQKEVDGYIEAFYPFTDDVCILCNDEGKINGSSLNRAILDDNGEILDIIAGTFLVVNCNGDFDSLTEEQLDKYYKMFERPETFMRANGKIYVVKQ